MAEKYTVVYQGREMDLTDGGVYTEYLMSSDASTSDLPTDCRASSLAYKQSSNTLYMFGIDREWAEVGGQADSQDDNEDDNDTPIK